MTDLALYGDGLIAVIIASLIELIPGCGPQIIAITAYTKDMLSFLALVANAISQDGDAIFPLLARHRVASLWATIHTTIPALIIGIGLMLFDITFKCFRKIIKTLLHCRFCGRDQTNSRTLGLPFVRSDKSFLSD